MLTFISVPSDFTTNIAATASGFFSDLSGVVSLIIGVLLATAVIGWLISHFTQK